MTKLQPILTMREALDRQKALGLLHFAFSQCTDQKACAKLYRIIRYVRNR